MHRCPLRYKHLSSGFFCWGLLWIQICIQSISIIGPNMQYNEGILLSGHINVRITCGIQMTFHRFDYAYFYFLLLPHCSNVTILCWAIIWHQKPFVSGKLITSQQALKQIQWIQYVNQTKRDFSSGWGLPLGWREHSGGKKISFQELPSFTPHII